MFPHILPVILALSKCEIAHFLKFVRRKDRGEVGEIRFDFGSFASEFHPHRFKGKEGIPCIPLSLFELLEDMRTLADCRAEDLIGIHT